MPEAPPRTAPDGGHVSIAIAAQSAYAFRTELVVMLPQTRSYYERF
jgi:hypothetical protein